MVFCGAYNQAIEFHTGKAVKFGHGPATVTGTNQKLAKATDARQTKTEIRKRMYYT